MKTIKENTISLINYISRTVAASAVILCFMLGTNQASAAITTLIKADNFSAGSAICPTGNEAGCSGAKLYGTQSSLGTFQILSETPDYGSALPGNTRIFGGGHPSDTSINSGPNDWHSSETFFAQFLQGDVTQVWLQILLSSTDNASATLRAYDAYHNVLDLDASGLIYSGDLTTLCVNSFTPISYVTLKVTDSFLNLNYLKFKREVPEPSTLLFIGFGLMGVLGLRHRK